MEETHQKQDKTLSWLVIVACVFVIRTYSWMTSELGYDEVLNLQRFVIPHTENPLGVFRDYAIANNHLLATWISCLWTALVGDFFSEYLFRLPSLLFGIGTIAVMMLHWPRRVGRSWALLGGLLLAVSPVFAAYAYQYRGYSLTLFLGTLAVSGLIDLMTERIRRGQCLLCISGLLLPLVIPSNLMLCPALGLTGLFLLNGTGRFSWRQALLAMVPWGISCILGGCYYLTILDQFRQAMAEPDGWASALQVWGNLLLGFAAHGAVAIAAVLMACRSAVKNGGRSLWLSVAAVLATILAVTFSGRSGHVPFPRVFLVLLPLATFLLLRLADGAALPKRLTVPVLAVAILVNGIIWERISEGLTDYQLKHGYFPDNLLQQYYRGSADLRELAESKLDLGNADVILDPYDAMSGAFYIRLMRQPDADGVAVGVNAIPDGAKDRLRQSPRRKLSVAFSEAQAREFLQRAGITVTPAFREICRTRSGRRGVYEQP